MAASRAHGKALPPEAAAAGGSERADAVGLVLFQQLTAAAEQAGSILELVYAQAEGPILFAVPDLAEILLKNVSERVVEDSAFMVTQIGVRRMEQSHTGGNVPVPADETVSLFDEAAPVGTAGDWLSLPGKKLCLLQTLFVREKQSLVSL